MEFYTIGVYNSTKEEYFKKLSNNNIDTFCDVRQRRGVRGAKYSFVNSNRLQGTLNEMEIKYAHILELSPTNEIRDQQKLDDERNKEQKRDRKQLGQIFKVMYQNNILKKFEFEYLFEMLEQVAASKIVFFCVEEHHKACHRSLITNQLEKLGYDITHL